MKYFVLQGTWRNKFFRSVHSFTHARLFETRSIEACQASLSITNSYSLYKLMSMESVMPHNHITLCFPLAFNLSQHQVLYQ